MPFVGPRLAIDLDAVGDRVNRLRSALRGPVIHFAVKANPHPSVLLSLRDVGVTFEVASAGEIELLDRLAIDMSSVIFSTPTRSAVDLDAAASCNISTFVVDSLQGVASIAEVAPASKVLARITVGSDGSHWPLSNKFGSTLDESVEILVAAKANGLRPIGVAFHVGSQAESLTTWSNAVADAAVVFRQAAAAGLSLTHLDVGGGFPVPYAGPVPSVEDIGIAIWGEIAERFQTAPVLLCEPGRYLVAEAGTLHTTVLDDVERRGERWLHLDAGVFNGMYEASAAGGGLPLQLDRHGGPAGQDVTGARPTVLAGPSCDGDDAIACDIGIPASVSVGDELRFANAGAYTLSYITSLCGLRAPTVVPHQLPRARRGVGRECIRASEGEDSFEQAAETEREVFALEGFNEGDTDLEGFGEYDKASVFNIVFEDGDPVAALREIWPSPLGFKTLNDFALPATSEVLLDHIGRDRLVEIGTVAVRPQRRGGDVALRCYASAVKSSFSHGISFWIASIDTALLHAFRDSFHFVVHDLGEPTYYYGSLTTPVLIDMVATIHRMRALDPQLWRAAAVGDYEDGMTLPGPTTPFPGE